ncbi:unnamed protein product [Discosporangium mesarthrocarpum]
MFRRRKIHREISVCFGRLELVGFKRDDKLKALDVSQALSAVPNTKPFKNGVVMVGGFGDTPFMWEGLISHLKQAGWFCLAPRTPGWGRSDFDEADRITWVEWVLACRDAIDTTRNLCERVTVVGHSTGAPVAAYSTEFNSVDRLIFTGPNFVSNPSDVWAKHLLTRPFVGPLVASFLGVVTKRRRGGGRPIDSLNVESYDSAFYLTCLPVKALRQMWLLQDQLSRPWKVAVEVIMLQGVADGSVAPLVDQISLVKGFVPEGIKFTACYMEDAAHGIPTETQPIVDLLAGVVLEEKAVLEKLEEEGGISVPP